MIMESGKCLHRYPPLIQLPFSQFPSFSYHFPLLSFTNLPFLCSSQLTDFSSLRWSPSFRWPPSKSNQESKVVLLVFPFLHPSIVDLDATFAVLVSCPQGEKVESGFALFVPTVGCVYLFAGKLAKPKAKGHKMRAGATDWMEGGRRNLRAKNKSGPPGSGTTAKRGRAHCYAASGAKKREHPVLCPFRLVFLLFRFPSKRVSTSKAAQFGSRAASSWTIHRLSAISLRYTLYSTSFLRLTSVPSELFCLIFRCIPIKISNSRKYGWGQ